MVLRDLSNFLKIVICSKFQQAESPYMRRSNKAVCCQHRYEFYNNLQNLRTGLIKLKLVKV